MGRSRDCWSVLKQLGQERPTPYSWWAEASRSIERTTLHLIGGFAIASKAILLAARRRCSRATTRERVQRVGRWRRAEIASARRGYHSVVARFLSCRSIWPPAPSVHRFAPAECELLSPHMRR